MSSLPHQSIAENKAFLPQPFFFAACLVLLGMAFFLAHEKFDPLLLFAVYRGGDAGAVRFWNFISTLASYPVLIPAAGAVTALLIWKREQVVALWLVAGFGMAICMIEMLKWLIARARPQVTFLAHASGYSFPSSHSAEAVFVFYFFWMILVGLPGREGRLASALRDLFSIVLSLLPALVGYSRVYLGVHWPSDVMGGWAVGFFVLGIVHVSLSHDEGA